MQHLLIWLCYVIFRYNYVFAQVIHSEKLNATTESTLPTLTLSWVTSPKNETAPTYTASATVDATHESHFIINQDFPLPDDLTKTGASTTSLYLRYNPPDKYLTDDSYSHFRVEYRRYHGEKWESISINKTSDPDNLVLHGLIEGVLYLVRMRTQTQNNFGVLVVSRPTQPIQARTKPLPITQLSAMQVASDWSEAILSWVDAPLEAFRSKYDIALLSYYIKDLPVDLRERFPVQNLTFERSFVSSGRSVTLKIIPGATYQFDVFTISTGADETASDVTSLSKKFEIPGPTDLRTGFYNETAMAIFWTRRFGVKKTSGFQVIWQEEETDSAQSLNTTFTTVVLSDLNPGSRYEVKVQSIQEENIFGKLSNASLFFTRTKPSALKKVREQRNAVTDTSLVFTFETPTSGQFDDVIIQYKIKDSDIEWKEASEVKLNKSVQTGSATLTGLLSGALYAINMTVVSEPGPQTSNSIIRFARTRPRLPTNIRTTSTGGTIYVGWRAPDIYSSVMWHYIVNYFPSNTRFGNETKTLCRDKGQALSRIMLPELEPGTEYAIFVTTIAGEDCSGGSTTGYITESTPSPQYTAYSQPAYPRIKFWKQATVSSVRVSWVPPEGDEEMRFDFYLVGVKRLQISDSYVVYEKEEFVNMYPKNQQSALLQLAQGAYYRINVTTAVGPKKGRQSSIVMPKVNSVQFRTWHRYYDHFVFPRLEWKFTTCGKTGRLGPSQRVCDSSYNNTNLHELVEVIDGIQHWVAPVDGLYRIVAAGAGYEQRGGLGAVVSGLFDLKEGSWLKIAVGQRGRSRNVEELEMIIGGGGGTFVVAGDPTSQENVKSDDSNIMLIAGGAGRGTGSTNFADAKLSYWAGNGSEVGLDFGLGGVADKAANASGMRGFVGTGGGAGYYGIAQTPVLLSDSDSAYPAVGFNPFSKNDRFFAESEDIVPLSGGRYQTGRNSYSEGGFGGGGCGHFSSGGGGGGYSGGGGGPRDEYSGGGGSFIKFTGGREMGEVTNNQDGFVVIKVVGLPMTSPVPMTFYLVISFIAGVVIALLCGASLFGVSKLAEKHFSKKRIPVVKDAIMSRVLDKLDQDERKKIEEAKQQQASDFHLDSQSSSDEEESVTEGSYDMNDDLPNGSTFQHHKKIASGETSSVLSESPVSSMATGFNEKKFVVDPKTGKLIYRHQNSGQINSSFTGFESSDSEDKVKDDAHGSSPPITSAPELASEEQKVNFKRKINLFLNLDKTNPKLKNSEESSESVVVACADI